ncbi:MAG: stage III sporulation protein AF [Clostridia bacterium]|nr:stage III sporulation protein AF [Clostridia bacterium]
MQALFDFVQKLSALVTAALLADLLMPAGAMRKYARLACGMLVLHIMVSQVFVFLGQSLPDTTTQEWTQLVGEIRALPADAGAEEALAAYRRQAERLILEKARTLGMVDPAVAIAWDAGHRAVAVILREDADSVAAGAQLGASAPSIITEATDVNIRTGVADMLGLPVESVWIQKEGDFTP